MEIQHYQQAAANRYGFERFGFGGMQLSSADRGWSGLSAELCCRVNKGVKPWRTPQTDVRVCVDVRGNESLVTRRAPGFESPIMARRGTVWLSPPGVEEGSVEFAANMTGILHIYLPLSNFSPANFNINALSYETALEDPLITEIGCAIASELRTETSVGSLLTQSLASSLAARLIQKYIGGSTGQSIVPLAKGALDRRRLQRVLDYIEANLEGDLNLDLMASIACLSRYHFARAFRQAVGQSPHRYVSARRLERAKSLLMQGDRSLVDIALSLSFSNQANFTRAFKQATGQAPGRYRLASGRREPLAANIRRPIAIPV